MKRSNIKHPDFRSAALLTSLIMAQVPALAQNESAASSTNAPTQLPDVVVQGEGQVNPVAERIEETRQTYPGAVSTVTPEELELQQPTHIGEIIARIPGAFYVDEDARGTKPNIALRGLDPIRSEHVQLLHDGVPIQPSMYSEQAGYYGVPAERVAGVEVFKGGTSILFGPNTVGGVVNFISRPLSPRPVAAVVDARVDSYGDYLGNLFVSGTQDRLSYGVEYMHKGGDGFRDSLGYKIHDVDGRLLYLFHPNHSAQIHLQYYDEESETPGGLLPSQFPDDREDSNKPNDVFFGNRIEGDIRTTHILAGRQRAEMLFYAYQFERDWFLQNYANNNTTDLTLADSNGQFLREFQVFGFEPKYTLDYDLGDTHDHQLTVGGRVYYDIVDRRSATGLQGDSREGDSTLTAHDELNSFVLAAFIQNEFKVTDRFSVTPGVRYEHIEQTRENVFAGESEDSESYGVWAPGVGLKYDLFEDTLLYANVTRSFRPPTFGDTFNPATGAGSFDLDASTAWTYEAGIRAQPYPWLLADVGGFYTDYKDQVIVSAGTAANFDTRAYGLESAFEVGLVGLLEAIREGNFQADPDHELAFVGGATIVNSTFTDGPFDGNDVPYVPREVVHYGLRYDYRGTYSLLFQGRYVGSRFTDNLNTVEENAIGTIGEMDDYTVYDLKARWRASEALSINAGVNNIFDEAYGTQRRTGSQKGIFPGPTRQFYASATVSF